MRSRQQWNRWSSGSLRYPNPQRPDRFVRIALIGNPLPVGREAGRTQHNGSIIAEVALCDQRAIATLAVATVQPDFILAAAVRDVCQEVSIWRPYWIGLVS